MHLFTDTHCHLDLDQFNSDREATLDRAWQAGLVWILNPGIDLPSSQEAINLSKANPGKIYAAVGVHPNYGEAWTEEILLALRDLAQQPEVVAIGEIGLDYYRTYTPRDQQQRMFKDQLTLAASLDLPVVIHNRDASHDLMQILGEWQRGLVTSENPLANRPGVLHSFSADLETAEAAMDLNFYLGISGPVTFTNAQDRKSITRNLPLNHLLLETDAPYLTPHPYRGKRNEPGYIPLIAAEIAKLHNISIEEVAEITYANAKRLFEMKAGTGNQVLEIRQVGGWENNNHLLGFI